MGRYFGREPRYSREEIELQAKQAIEARISMGRPPAEDFAPIVARLAELDRARAASLPAPPIPAGHTDLRVTEVRLPAAATAPRTPPAAAKAPVRGRLAPAPRPAVVATES